MAGKKPGSGQGTVIEKGTVIVGKITSDGDITVRGEIDGTLRASGSVKLSSHGSVKGEIYADEASISGAFEGKIESNTVEIEAGGRVGGSILYREMVIDSKGLFEGTCEINQETPTPVIAKR